MTSTSSGRPAATGGGHGWKWLVSDPGFGEGLAAFRAGLWYDAWTAPLLAMVAGVSFLVHLFSIGYMKGNSRYSTYFAGLALFSFAMLAMLVSDNLLFVFGFWESHGPVQLLAHRPTIRSITTIHGHGRPRRRSKPS